MVRQLKSLLSEEQNLDKTLKHIKIVISQICDKAKEQGIEPIKVKVDSIGDIYKFTVQTEFGSCSSRFNTACFEEDNQEAAQVRNFLIKKLINKLMQYQTKITAQ